MISGSADRAESADEDSPFRPPARHSHDKRQPIDPSVMAEPWMQVVLHEGVVNDVSGFDAIADPNSVPELSVWDETGLSLPLSGDLPTDGLTWRRYFESRSRETKPATTWLVTAGVAAASGPLAVLGALMPTLYSSYDTQLVTLAVVAPTVEEILKVALPFWVVEKRPWLFGSRMQILACTFSSGMAFAAVENLMYLNLYIQQPSAGIAAWRWTVCVLLHASCSLLSGFGIARVWARIRRDGTRPDPALATAAIISAIAVHGCYNALAAMLEAGGFAF